MISRVRLYGDFLSQLYTEQRNRLEQLESEVEIHTTSQQQYEAKLAKLTQRLDISKDVAAECLGTINIATQVVSPAEREFMRKLEEWKKHSIMLDNRVTRVDRETHPRGKMPQNRRRSSDPFSSATDTARFTLPEQDVNRVQELQHATWGLLKRAESTSTQASRILKSLSKDTAGVSF